MFIGEKGEDLVCRIAVIARSKATWQSLVKGGLFVLLNDKFNF